MDLKTKVFTQSMGAEVINHKGERIGYVTEVKKDATGKKIEYIVVCSSELFGEGNRYFAVPACSSLIKATKRGNIILYIDKEDLQIATGVHALDCPKTNPEFSESILELYHYEATETNNLEMSGKSIKNDRQYA